METSWAELDKWEIQDQSGCLGLHKRARTVCLVDYSDIIKKARSGSLLLLSVWLKWQITWMSWVTQYHWAASGALFVSKQQGGGPNSYYGLYYSMGAIVRHNYCFPCMRDSVSAFVYVCLPLFSFNNCFWLNMCVDLDCPCVVVYMNGLRLLFSWVSIRGCVLDHCLVEQ